MLIFHFDSLLLVSTIACNGGILRLFPQAEIDFDISLFAEVHLPVFSQSC